MSKRRLRSTVHIKKPNSPACCHAAFTPRASPTGTTAAQIELIAAQVTGSELRRRRPWTRPPRRLTSWSCRSQRRATSPRSWSCRTASSTAASGSPSSTPSHPRPRARRPAPGGGRRRQRASGRDPPGVRPGPGRAGRRRRPQGPQQVRRRALAVRSGLRRAASQGDQGQVARRRRERGDVLRGRQEARRPGGRRLPGLRGVPRDAVGPPADRGRLLRRYGCINHHPFLARDVMCNLTLFATEVGISIEIE
jgi:hypothetical protein